MADNIPVTGRCDEVQQNVHTVVAESGVTLNTRFLCENVIVLTLEVADDLSEAVDSELMQSSLLI